MAAILGGLVGIVAGATLDLYVVYHANMADPDRQLGLIVALPLFFIAGALSGWALGGTE